MRRVLSALVGLLLVMPMPAAADPGHAPPKITLLKFLQTPLKSGIDEVLKVVAHDPDSWISEVQVQWADANHSGGAVFAHTYCVQDPDYSDPGTPAKLKIPVHFENPGNYHLEARAISSINCAGDDTSKTSKSIERDVIVIEALETFTDPDDTPGDLDIVALEQTQETPPTSITPEVVHRLRMSEPWSEEVLAGPAVIELWFDLDNDPDRFDRVLTVDVDERDGNVRAAMLNANNGQSRGYAAVFRPDDRTLEVRFPPTLLKEGAHNYTWYAAVFSPESSDCPLEAPCTDTAPDSGSNRHRL